jgi:UMF1 family MFS transporter
MEDVHRSRRRGSRRRARYIDEDTSPTTERELRGWYSYGVAAEVFAVAGLGSFLPVTLEQLARERGVLKGDGITSCTTGSTAAKRHLAMRADDAADNACVVNILGAKINTSSFALYTFSLAVGVQALVLISISAIADHGGLHILVAL